MSARARREEFEMQRLRQEDEYKRQQQKAVLEVKRACYITVIAAARRYRIELMRYLYAVKEGTADDSARARLEDARLTFNTSLAETQLTAAMQVLKALNPIRDGLSESYSAIMDLSMEDPEFESEFGDIRAFMLKLWDSWPPAHAAMRDDLGVED